MYYIDTESATLKQALPWAPFSTESSVPLIAVWGFKFKKSLFVTNKM